MLKPLVFFGNERLATAASTSAPTLRALVEAGYPVKAVVTSYTPGTSRQERTLEIAEVAKELNVPVMYPSKVSDIQDDLKDIGAEAGVLVAFGQIIPKEIIDIFPRGIINIHPSLLPLYRGPTPIETAILDGQAKTGVSLMKLAPKMDAGDVYVQSEVALAGTESKQELADRLLKTGSQLLLDNLSSILDGSLIATPQADDLATYTRLLTKSDGLINLGESAKIIERQVRAFQGYPKPRLDISGHGVILLAVSRAEQNDDKRLIVDVADGYLSIDRLIAPSGRSMSGADFKIGYLR
jgi:methionyl-tRNA formyltransferase